MPLNTLRLNHQKSSHPNDRIVFIKPLPRPDADKASYDIADTFLRAIAAQCLPIMKSHHLSVTTLAEHEPNREFIGRNFNNGEVIELVLRNHAGGWVNFQMVQLVMMHELSHNVHMNHSKQFWQTKDLFTKEMKGLWARRYTGEGFWGGGRVLGDLSSVMGNNIVPSDDLQDIEVCGGTFRSRRKKRKNDAADLTWKEKRNRRIEKKFGKNGQALGEDEYQRLRLEIARNGPIGVKPRVAGSKRGRELRAAAALARFGPNKEEVEEVAKKADERGDEQEYDEYEEIDEPGEDVMDSHGQRILDGNGHGLIRVCGKEDGSSDDAEARKERQELEELDDDFMTHYCDHEEDMDSDDETPATNSIQKQRPSSDVPKVRSQFRSEPPAKRASEKPKTAAAAAISNTISCPICTISNDRLNPTCTVCSHVLDKRKMPSCWSCSSEACQGSAYINAGDSGLCGVCSSKKSQLG